MANKMNQADIYAMFERIGVDPVERDLQQWQDQAMYKDGQQDGRKVVYRTVLTDGTGKSMRGGTDAELEQNAR